MNITLKYFFSLLGLQNDYVSRFQTRLHAYECSFLCRLKYIMLLQRDHILYNNMLE